jgi:hypothetical protein
MSLRFQFTAATAQNSGLLSKFSRISESTDNFQLSQGSTDFGKDLELSSFRGVFPFV